MTDTSRSETLAQIGHETIAPFKRAKSIDNPVGNTSNKEWLRTLFVAEGDRFELWATHESTQELKIIFAGLNYVLINQPCVSIRLCGLL
jgi:hypothetical protein